jgi:hypothetical protein
LAQAVRLNKAKAPMAASFDAVATTAGVDDFFIGQFPAKKLVLGMIYVYWTKVQFAR